MERKTELASFMTRFLIKRAETGLALYHPGHSVSTGITGFILLISTPFLISLIHFSAIADLQY